MANSGADRVYTLPELAKLSAIDYRTLHNWQKRGMLRASHRAVNGSGSANLFDETDALQLLILAELRKSGVEVRALELVAERVRELIGAINGEELLVISEDRVALKTAEELHQSVRGERPSVVLSVAGPLRALRALASTA
jgi:DNA-binding transcriptional MerR regulator